MEFREILSRIPFGFESRQNHAVARNPGVGMSGQVLFHPSHICQISKSDQCYFESFVGKYGRGWVGALDVLSESLDGFLEIRESAVSGDRKLQKEIPVKVPHGTPRKSNEARNYEQVRLIKNILIISVSCNYPVGQPLFLFHERLFSVFSSLGEKANS